MNIQFGGRNKFRAQRVRALTRTLAVAVAVLLISTGIVRAPTARADSLLDFTGTTVSGAPFNGASLKGKPVVLWFWAAYCPFCNGEGPHVSAVSAANPRVTFVGISGRGSVGDMEAFISRYNLHFTNLNDADGSLWRQFGVPWQPAYLFINSNGTSDFVNNPTSSMSEQELSDRVKALT
ncbi:MAG: protein disulfide oxidoreductase [Mycobacterium sp.]